MKQIRTRFCLGLVLAGVVVALPSFGVDSPKADLVCSISVSKNADGTDTIGKDGTLSYSNPKSKFYVHVAASNQGKANAVAVAITGALWRGTNDLAGAFTKKDSQIPPGTSVDVQAIEFKFGDRGDHFKVTAQVDKANAVDESNESNNACELEFDTKRGGAQNK
jgi:CARDB